MAIKTGYWVKIVADAVVECWDTTPPVGQDGWREAVEVTPDLTPNREILTTHSFDITKNPVEIVWSKRELSVDERKGSLIGQAEFQVMRLENELQMKRNMPEFADQISTLEAEIEAAKSTRDARVIQVNAAATHEDVDALM